MIWYEWTDNCPVVCVRHWEIRCIKWIYTLPFTLSTILLRSYDNDRNLKKFILMIAITWPDKLNSISVNYSYRKFLFVIAICIKKDSNNDLSKDTDGLTLKFHYQQTNLDHLLNWTCMRIFHGHWRNICNCFKFEIYMYLSLYVYIFSVHYIDDDQI